VSWAPRTGGGRRALLDVLHQLPAALADYYAEVAGSVPEWPKG